MGREKKCPTPANGTPGWMTTFGDMNSLLLVFFIAMLTSAEVDGREMHLILSAFDGSMGALEGGNTLSKGELAELGNTVESLPAIEVGNQLAKAVKESVEMLSPEIKARKGTYQSD